MTAFNRREFLELGATLAVSMGLGMGAVPKLAEAAQKLSSGATPIIWLQGQSCSGCSVSLLNSAAPTPVEILTQYISLLFHSTLSTATGETAMSIVHESLNHDGFFLAVEGSIPEKMPKACIMGEEPVGDLVLKAAKKAAAVLAIGTCSSFGGIPAAENNVTGAINTADFLKKNGVATPVIRIPGCPAHPDWIVGTLVHVIAFGMPKLDHLNRPTMFYNDFIHQQCPRFADYEEERFAQKFTDDGCLFKLGCFGPITKADCNYRQWNDGTNTCIRAGAPCIGCASEQFMANAKLPMYTLRANETTHEG